MPTIPIPIPGTQDLHQSQQVEALLIDKITLAGGYISFATYMECALYSSSGFYQSANPIFGDRGHFTTASELSPFYGKCFAHQIAEINSVIDHSKILEIGAGSGRFAWQVLQELKILNCLPSHYYILEKSAALAKAQQDLLSTLTPEIAERVIWLNALPKHFDGVIVCNEVLDALPVTCFKILDNDFYERVVIYRDKRFIWHDIKAQPKLNRRLKTITQNLDLPNSYCSEVNLSYDKFIPALTQCLNRGVILLADYGYGRQEYYHPERSQGTLTCFYQHHRHDDPFLYPGLQDLTAHVDFTAVAELAGDCILAGYCTQTAFLLSMDILNYADQSSGSPQAERRMHAEIKQLLYPTEMGERVKIMALSKHLDLPLRSFSMQDRSREL